MKESATVKRREPKHKYKNGSDSWKNNTEREKKRDQVRTETQSDTAVPTKGVGGESREQKKSKL